MSGVAIRRPLVWPMLLILTGCALFDRGDPSPQPPKPVSLRIGPASEQAEEGYKPARDERGQPLHVAEEPWLTEADVATATVLRSERRSLLLLEFTPMAAGQLEWLSQSHLGRRLAVTIDDRLIMAPVLTKPIQDGRLVLDGDFSAQRAEQIARGLNVPHSTTIGRTP